MDYCGEEKNKLKYKGYIGYYLYSNKDKVFYGQLFNVKDLISFEGKTLHKLRRNFKRTVRHYIKLGK